MVSKPIDLLPSDTASAGPLPTTAPRKAEPGTVASSSPSSIKREWPRTPAHNSETPDRFPIQFVKGVGPRIAELLEKKEILTAEDLLSFFPYKYLDRRLLQKIGDMQPGPDRVTAGKILTCGIAFTGRKRKIFEILLGDDSGTVSLKWFRFNPRQMMGAFKQGMGLIVSGEATRFRNEV